MTIALGASLLSGGSGPAGHRWFRSVSDTQLGDAMDDCKPAVPSTPLRVSKASAESIAVGGMPYLHGTQDLIPTEALFCLRYGRPYWAVLVLPPGGIEVSSNYGPVHQAGAVDEIDALTGEATSGFTIREAS